jgi:hypothetical protein
MECEFCNKIFTTKSNLKVHQSKTKSCLIIQNKNPEKIYNCLYCNKIFTIKDTLDRHIASHLTDPIFIKLQKLEEEKKHLEESLKNALEQVKMYQEQNEKLLMKAISTPKVKNTYNTVNIENFTAMTDEHFEKNAKFLTMEHIKNGAHGYATFIVKYPCKDSIVVADRARRTIKYKDENNELCIDVEARNLLTKISKAIDPINRELLLKAGEELDANKNMDLEYKLSLKSKFLEYCNGIKFMGGAPTEFSRKLAHELMILIPKRVSGVIEENTNDEQNLLEDEEMADNKLLSDVESEIIYYSDS